MNSVSNNADKPTLATGSGKAPEAGDTREGLLRELDAEVAERVMGYRWNVVNRRRKEFRSPSGLIVAYVDGKETNYTGYRTPNLPNYSTDIAAAMEVVEKLAGDGWCVNMVREDESPVWWVEFDRHKVGLVLASAESDSLPEAICRAALAAIDSTQ